MTDAFTYAELDEILRGSGHAGAIGMSAIDGLIAALVTAPSFVDPDEWVPLVFGGHPPPLDENSPELGVVKTIFNRYTEVSDILADRPQAYRPIFMVDDDGSVVVRDLGGRLRSGSGCAPRNGGSTSCSPSAAKRWSRSCSTARASSISCRTCRLRNSAGGKPPPTQKSPRPSPPSAPSAIPIAPPRPAGNRSNDAAPAARASSGHKASRRRSSRTAYAGSAPLTEIEQDGKVYLLRNPAPGCAGPVLRTLGVALPPLVRNAQPPPSPPPRKPQKPGAVVPTPLLCLLTR